MMPISAHAKVHSIFNTQFDMYTDIPTSSSFIVDSTEQNSNGLFMCTRDNPSESNPDAMSSRGIVYDSSTLDVVSRCLPFSYEKTPFDFLCVNDDTWMDDCKIYPSVEGTQLRMFCHKDCWYLTTSKKLNAFNSRWIDSRSFGHMFVEYLCRYTNKDPFLVMNEFTSFLDKTRTYIFLITSSTLNRRASLGLQTPDVFHIGTYTSTFSLFDTDDVIVFPESASLEPCRKLDQLKFESVAHMSEYVSNLTLDTQGVILFMPDGIQIKFTSDLYRRAADVRGNDYSILYRYLSLHADADRAGLLKYMFPENARLFAHADSCISDLAEFLFNVYRARYIYRNIVRVDAAKHLLLKTIHQHYLSNREANRITRAYVYSAVQNMDPRHLYNMINMDTRV